MNDWIAVEKSGEKVETEWQEDSLNALLKSYICVNHLWCRWLLSGTRIVTQYFLSPKWNEALTSGLDEP